MPTEVWRAGDYRTCPSCGTRHKVQDLRCSRCHTVLAGAPVRHSQPARVVPIAAPSRGMRALVVAGVVVALASGLWVRSLFRGAALNDSVEASTVAVPEAPAPQPTWTPPALSYPPIVGYNQGVPPSMAALAIQGSPLPTSAPVATSAEPAGTASTTSMTSIAPPSEPTRKTAFTNDDLVRMRGGQGAPAVAMPAAATAAPSMPPANAAFVPVASNEEAQGAVASYECCKFRGNLVALDVATGKQVWKTYTVGAPKPTKKNAVGTQLYGPSGVPIWSSPAIDPQRNAVYATTGNNYTDPPSERSDAFVAFDLDTGKVLWARQTTAKDAYVAACRMVDKTNCADSNGPDFDFGASPILVELGGGKRALLAGQKSGVVYALDPDRGGEMLWRQRVGQGGSMGGVQWGSAADGTNVYVAVSDVHRIPVPNAWATDADPKQGGGMFALRLRDGVRAWHTPPAECGERPRCSPAQPGAVSGIPGAVLSGSMDGHVRAYSTTDGSVLWDFDTVRSYETANGVPGRGGSLDGAGPAIAGGLVIVNSGYPHGGGMPGNVVLALSVDGK